MTGVVALIDLPRVWPAGTDVPLGLGARSSFRMDSLEVTLELERPTGGEDPGVVFDEVPAGADRWARLCVPAAFTIMAGEKQ